MFIMRKILLLSVLMASSWAVQAQQDYGKQFLSLQRKAKQTRSTSTTNTVRFSDITQWVGTGDNQAAVAIVWNDGLASDTLVWGYRFSGNATGEDMLKAVVNADPRLYAVSQSGQYGTFVSGIGYDLNNDARTGIYMNGNLIHNAGGWYVTSDASATQPQDAADHFHGGYDSASGKYFAYLVADGEGAFASSQTGASGRTLQNGSRDIWVYQTFSDAFALGAYNVAPMGKVFANGTFFLNEGWFGREASHINFLSDGGTWTYRAFAEANPNHTLGNTSQFGTIYGGRIYIMSKQNHEEGGRLIVANAANLSQIVSFETLPNNADGRAFAPIDETTAFVSTSKGLLSYDMVNNQFLGSIDVGTVEMGNILVTNRYVYVETAEKKVLVINPDRDELVKTIDNAYQPVQSKDGRVWVVSGNKLLAFNPFTLEPAGEIDVTGKAPKYAAGAWNAGLFFAGNQNNTLYWGYGTRFEGASIVYKVNLDDSTHVATEVFSLQGKDTPYIYGAAMRLRPSDDHLFLQAFTSWGSQKYTVFHLDANGVQVASHALTDHYWFPALPIFTDAASPVFAPVGTQTLTVGESRTLPIAVTDADSYNVAIYVRSLDDNDADIATAEIRDGKLHLTGIAAGETQVTLHANSNGYTATTAFAVKVEETTSVLATSHVGGTLGISGGKVFVSGMAGETLSIFSLDGKLVAQYAIASPQATFALPHASRVYVVKAGKLSVKAIR